jgi:hypothetical protein
MDLVVRAKGILLDPQTEWRTIAAEPASPAVLITGYVAILAAIPAVCGFIGTSIIGIAGYRTPFFAGLLSAILGYVISLAGVFIVAFVIDALAPTFGGRKDFIGAMKVAAYAPTAAWLASVFTALPVLAILAALGLYSLYLFYVGLPILMRAPRERALGYFLAVMVGVIIVWAIILFLPGRLFGFV